MLLDKSGLRKKPKDGGKKKRGSKYTEQDLIEMNREAGRAVRDKFLAEGKLTPTEVADMVREELKTSKQNG